MSGLCSLESSFLFFLVAVLSASSSPNYEGHLKPLGSHRPAQGQVQTLFHVPSPTVFFDEYVRKSQAVIFKGAAKYSKGFFRWTDVYLNNMYGDVIVNVDYGKKENRERPADKMKLSQFLTIYNTSNRYLVDTLPREMWKEYSLLKCLLCGGFTNGLQDAVLWFSSGGTKSFLHVDNIENINCLLSGRKEIFFIDKEHTKNVEMDHQEGEYCGVDVDSVDMIRYPSLRDIPWWSARVQAGDCIYIPYGWAHQVTSYDRNLAVNIWWTVMDAINTTDCHEKEKILDENSQLSEELDKHSFTIGEHLRFQLLQVLRQHGGQISFDKLRSQVVHEHNGKPLISEESFSSLDLDHDGVLTEMELKSHSSNVISEALQHTHPGEVNIKGHFQSRDAELENELKEEFHRQPAHVQEFLLRHHKSKEDIETFLQHHGLSLTPGLKNFLLKGLREKDNEASHVEL